MGDDIRVTGTVVSRSRGISLDGDNARIISSAVSRGTAPGRTGFNFFAGSPGLEVRDNRAEGNLGGGFAIGVSAVSSGIAVVGASALRNLFTGIAVPPVCPGCTVDDSRAADNSAWDYCGAAALTGNDFGTVCP